MDLLTFLLFFLFFLRFYLLLFYMYEHFSKCLSVYHHLHEVLAEASRGHRIPWDWSYSEPL